MWVKPWTFKEGFAVGGGLVLVGLLLQATVGAVKWKLMAFPVNVVVGVIFVAAMLILFALHKKIVAFDVLARQAMAVPALVFTVVLTALMGVVRQAPDGHAPTDVLGLTRMLSWWPFVLVYVWLAVCLAQVTLHRLWPLKLSNVPFLLNHLGLLWILLTATLGNADMKRLKMTIGLDSPEWRATDDENQIHELPIALQLKNFTIDEYPPKLIMIDNASGEAIPKDKPTALLLDSTFQRGIIMGWHVQLLERLDEAAPMMTVDTTRFLPWHSTGAVPAVFIKVTRDNGRTVRQGWVSCGSYQFPYQLLKLDNKVSLAMPEREPECYRSEIEVMTRSGKHLITEIAVNKPFDIEGWKIYQLSYDTRMGKWSTTSVVELVADPWLPFVYAGVGALFAGSLCLVFMNPRRKEETE